MSSVRKHNALLTEILIAVLFFALCSVVLLETFLKVADFADAARCETEALMMMQDMAEQIYASDDWAAFLDENAPMGQDGLWQKETDEYRITFVLDSQADVCGELKTAQIASYREDVLIAEFECARYLPAEVNG